VLMLACRDRQRPVVSYLLSYDTTNLEVRNNDGETALSIACQRGYTEITRLLLERGARRDVLNQVTPPPPLLLPSLTGFLERILDLYPGVDDWRCGDGLLD
jgi:ankyrin repeat protein